MARSTSHKAPTMQRPLQTNGPPIGPGGPLPAAQGWTGATRNMLPGPYEAPTRGRMGASNTPS